MYHNAEQLPGNWVICNGCRGEGHHCKHLGAYTREEFDEQFSYEEQQAYFEGAYDKPCEECKGTGKVWCVDVKRCTFSQKRTLVERRRDARADAEMARQYRAEMRLMGDY